MKVRYNSAIQPEYLSFSKTSKFASLFRSLLNMPFQLSEIKDEAEFAKLVEVEHLAYQKPYNAF
jgi:hypothetical protein